MKECWTLCLSKLILAESFLIVDSEGFSLSIYTDKTGHPTIGYGYNLSVYSYEISVSPKRMGF
ncbi:lysozyme [Helicobacter pylori]|nr:lysozyme [Helicobacter pylori]WRF04535.1 lysozyme [Helicobacter pylori]